MSLQLEMRVRQLEERCAAIEGAREIAREEVASLCGLVLSRLHADPQEPLAQKLASAFGEALRDFGATKSEPGPKNAA